MTTQISSTNIQPATLAALSPVTITGITVTNSSWTPLDDSAVSTSGGFIVITGTNFATGCNVIIGSTNATSVAFVNSTTLRVQVPAMSAGTYVVYVTNTNGTTAIIVNGLTYSGTPTWVTASPLTPSTVGTPISIQLSATGDTPLTYALQAGSTLPSGLTLSSSGLLSGTVTGLTVETTYNFTIEAIDPQLQDSPKAFAITIVAGDQFWDNVTLLLPGTTSTSIFNDDASTNNFPITVVGDTRPNNFGPYTPGYYSNFFDGTGDFLRVPSTGAGFSSITTFTYESWIYPTAALTTNCIFDISECQPFRFVLSSTNVTWQATSSGGTILTANFNWVIGAWHHVVFVRDSSNNISIFINGIRYATTTAGNWGSTASSGVNIGCNRGDTWFFTGYISNARFVKGTAIYDPTATTITVPTTPLTSVSGTSLLTCQSNRFIDNSVDNLAVTRNGDVRIDGFDPFVPSSSTATLGSTYFDGTGDYLSTAGNAAFAMGTGDFTLEAWIYPTSFASYWPITGQFASLSTGQGFNLFALNSSRQIELYYDGQTYAALSSTTATLNTWNHVTVARQGSTIRGFINGVLAGTITYSGIFGTSSSNLEIGGTTRSGGNLWALGYISNARVVKGTALYTTAFTPPAAPLTAVAGTSLLTCQTNQPNNNNMFLDSSTNNFLITRNGNTTQGTFSPYAENWSNYFDGSGDYLVMPAIPGAGTGDFTLEAWVYPTTAGTGRTVLDSRSQDVLGPLFLGLSTSNKLDLIYSTSSPNRLTSTGDVPANTWTHIAAVRNSGTITLYINGVQNGSVAFSGSVTGPGVWWIGAGRSDGAGNPGYYFTGYISNVRVNNSAIYTANFTPSTTPLLPIANTSLLTCRDGSIVDDSANRYAITVVGNTSVQKFGPFAGTTLPTPYYGAYFDGTGDFLTIPDNAALQMGTGNFTIEFWINFSSIASYQTPFDKGYTGSGALLFQTGDGNGRMVIYASGSAVITESGTATVGTWIHYALVRNGSTLTLYRNGTSSGSATNSTNFNNSSQLGIGATGVAPPGGSIGMYSINGYLSNVRIVKGTALYTENFTPPTQPLTAITNTSLLTCQSNRFIDNSTNNFAIAVSGNSQPTFFNPFTVTYSTLQSYSPNVFGGSMYFDGTGDFLTVPTNTAFSLSADFTVEFWINTSVNGVQGIISTGNGATIQPYFYLNGLTPTFLYNNINVATGPNITLNAWNHIAYSRSGSSIRVFTNGVAGTTASPYTDSFTNSGIWISGSNSNTQLFTGYVSDVRIVKGTALYTSNFVPSNQPLTAVQNSVLLLNGTAAAIYDASAQNDSETLADSNLSTSIVKFGNTSMFFDGTGDFLRFDNSTFRLISGNFTIECHFYETSATGFLFTMSSRNWWPQNNAGEGMNGLAFGPRSILLGIGSGGGAQYNYSSGATLNTWNHIAVCRVNSTVSVYINGLQVLSQTINNQPIGSLNTSPGIGLLDAFGGTPRLFFTGYIQDFRITSGVARYTTNFTPPTTPFLTN